MNKRYGYEGIVGIFVLLGIIAFIALAFKVSGLTHWVDSKGYDVTAEFINIGNLKVRAPIAIAGVRIGEVKSITLDPDSFYANVTLHIENEAINIPLKGTSVRILTEGLLGANYLSIEPGYGEEEGQKQLYLKEGDSIEKTQPAMILEDILGQLIFSINK